MNITAEQENLDSTILKKIHDKYGATHTIQKVLGTEINLPDLKYDELVCAGDGKTYHFLLTKVSASIAQFPDELFTAMVNDEIITEVDSLEVHNKNEILKWLTAQPPLHQKVQKLREDVKENGVLPMNPSEDIAFRIGAAAAVQAFKEDLQELLPDKEQITDRSRFYKGKPYTPEEAARMGIYWLKKKIEEVFKL